jgi:hypothetical protein
MKNRTVALALVTGLVATLAGCRPTGNNTAGTDSASTDSGYSTPDNGSSTTPAPRREPPPPPPPRVTTVPAGTVVSIELLDSVGSDISTAGTRVRARVADDVRANGIVAIREGTAVSGVVTEAVGLKKIGGTPKLVLDFTGIGNSDTHASYATTGKSETKKDAGTIAGATAGGAILGRIIGHQKDNDARGTAIGAVVGAGVGTAIAAKTKGQEITLPSGHVIEIVLDQPLEVTTRG